MVFIPSLTKIGQLFPIILMFITESQDRRTDGYTQSANRIPSEP